ncbi:MAG: DUF4411 family protein [Bifidobacteriaceae bacterium]|jgi:hypothetical protein|nr:DUF4411 family protein [Bifidobacteriaceae bacterium]
MTHTLDTSILIGLVQRYPREVFKSLWDSVEAAARSGQVCICQEVLPELRRGGDYLEAWAKGIAGFVCQATDNELATAAAISQAHPGWVSEQKNAADPFIIAHAEETGRVIVTDERRAGPGTADRNQKIPNVADERGVRCVTFLGFMRSQGWRF